MSTNAKSAFGTSFTWNTQVVADLDNIGGIELSIDMLDVTTHNGASRFKEKIAGIADAGDLSISGNFHAGDTNGQIAMVADAAAGTSRAGIVTFPSSLGVWTFTGLISKIKVGDTTAEGKIPFSATVSITGTPTLAVTASNNITVLTITTATSYPTFVATTYSYVAVSMGNTCTFTATFAAGTAILTANGLSQALTTAVPSSTISLGADLAKTEVTIVVTETGKAPKTYTWYIANTA